MKNYKYPITISLLRIMHFIFPLFPVNNIFSKMNVSIKCLEDSINVNCVLSAAQSFLSGLFKKMAKIKLYYQR